MEGTENTRENLKKNIKSICEIAKKYIPDRMYSPFERRNNMNLTSEQIAFLRGLSETELAALIAKR